MANIPLQIRNVASEKVEPIKLPNSTHQRDRRHRLKVKRVKISKNLSSSSSDHCFPSWLTVVLQRICTSPWIAMIQMILPEEHVYFYQQKKHLSLYSMPFRLDLTHVLNDDNADDDDDHFLIMLMHLLLIASLKR